VAMSVTSYLLIAIIVTHIHCQHCRCAAQYSPSSFSSHSKFIGIYTVPWQGLTILHSAWNGAYCGKANAAGLRYAYLFFVRIWGGWYIAKIFA